MNVEKLATKEEFEDFVNKLKAFENYKKPLGFGIARIERGQLNKQKILSASFPVVNWKENFGSAAIFVASLKALGVDVDFSKSEFVCDVDKKFVKNALKFFDSFLDEAKDEEHKNIQVLKQLKTISKNEALNDNYRLVFIYDDKAPQSVEALYLKLYALSLDKAPLRSLNLDGAFSLLENVAWSMGRAIELEWLRQNEISLKLNGNYPFIESVDKFPRYLGHIIPNDKTRILESSKVRMGAKLSEGTTVMPGASYVNFNAGTEGVVMVEGRISSSVVVGEGSDVGGGASILGVLSGTNGNAISIGKNTLLGANSVTGIPLGDNCIIDAGIAILEGTKVSISNDQVKLINEINPHLKLDEDKTNISIKALSLGNANGLHFRQNSKTGAIEAYKSKRQIKLNEQLHN